MAATVPPGTVLVVRDSGIWAWWIRLGEWLKHQPSRWNHVAVYTHTDEAGTPWGVEGRPDGGVGQRDLTRYLHDPATLHNAAQLAGTTGEQRALICAGAAALLPSKGQHIRYDWPAIVRDGLSMVDPLYRPEYRDAWGPGVPTQVVCSSMADWLYEHVGLATPDADRYCTPGDWARFIQRRGWV